MYSGLTAAQGEEVRRVVLDTMSSQRWSVGRIRDRITPILVAGGFDPYYAAQRAENIARTESAAVLSEYRLRVYAQDEAQRGIEYQYRYSGVNDARRTKLSRWIGALIGEGLPLRVCLAIMDDGVRLAKTGAFDDGGQHANVPGVPIRLPPNFQRRGFVCHYGERDSLVRVIQ